MCRNKFLAPQDLSNQTGDLGKGSIEKKKRFSFGLCPNSLPPPLTPIRATWSFFSDVKIQGLKVSLELRILYILYTVYMQPKKQLKVQYIGIFEEIDCFY